MSIRKRKKDRPEDVPQSILESKRELGSDRKEEKRWKTHEIEMLDAGQGQGGEDIDKPSAKKKNSHRNMKKEQLETYNSPTKNEQSGKHEIEVSKVGKDEGQQGRASAKQKSRAQKNLQVGSPNRALTALRVWTLNEEIVLLSVIVDTVRPGNSSPVNINSIDWVQLSKKVSQKLESNLTRTQVYEKARRLKNRYLAVEQKLNAGTFNGFKNANEEEAHRLCQQIWGGCVMLQVDEEDADPVSGTKKVGTGNGIISRCNDSQGLHHAETPKAKIDNLAIVGKSLASESIVPSFKEHKTVLGETFCPNLKERLAEDRQEELRSPAMEWDAQRMLDMLGSEHQAFLKKIHNSCQLVLEEVQGKLVAVVENAVKDGVCQVSPSMGGMHVSSFDIFHPATLGPVGDFVEEYIPSSSLECVKPAIESLQKQWRQQHLEELKLTSGRLKLLLEECHTQHKKIEREMIKNCKL